MAQGSLGSFLVDFQLRLAQFSAQADKVTSTMKGFEKLSDSLNSKFRQAFGALTAGLTIAAAVSFVKDQLAMADATQKLSDSLGISVESMSGFQAIAQMSGASTEDFTKGATKLATALAKAAAGNEDAKKLFKAFDIDPGTINNITSLDKALLQFSDRFKELGNSPIKAAAAAEVFSDKLGVKLLPFISQGSGKIKELMTVLEAFGGSMNSGFTKNAERFQDAMGLLGAAAEGFKRRFVVALAPVLVAAAETFLEMRKESVATQGTLDKLTPDPITKFAVKIIEVIGDVMDAFAELTATIDKFRNFSLKAEASKAAGGIISDAKERFLGGLSNLKPQDILNPLGTLTKGAVDGMGALDRSFSQRVGQIFTIDPTTADKPGAAFVARFKANLKKIQDTPVTPTSGGTINRSLENAIGNLLKGDGSKEGNNVAQKILDGILKDLEREIQEANSELQDRLGFLQTAFQQNFLAIDDYYQRKANAQEESTAKTLAAIDKEIAALQAYLTTPGLKPEQAVEAQNKIAAAVDKRADAEKKAAVETAKAYYDQAQAIQAYRRQVEDVAIQILELEGRLGEAARKRFQLSNEDFRNRLRAEATSADPEKRATAERTQESLDRLERAAGARAEINELTERGGIIQDQLRNAEDRFEIARKRGTIGEIELLRRSDAERRAAAVSLAGIAAQYSEIAANSGDPRLIQNAENFRVEVEKLAASANQLADRFDEIGTSALGTFFSDVITGTKSVKDAFKDMTDSIFREITNLIAKDLAKDLFRSLFGENDQGVGGFGGFFAKIFGGGGTQQTAGGSGGGGGLGGILAGLGGLFGKSDGGLIPGQTPPYIPAAQAAEIARRFPNGIPANQTQFSGGDTVLQSMSGMLDTFKTESSDMFRTFNTGLDGTFSVFTSGLSGTFDQLASSLSGAFGSLFSGGGNLFGGGSSGGPFDFLTSLFGGAAEGADLSGGQPVVVGEKGSEIFVPAKHASVAERFAQAAASVASSVKVNAPAKTDKPFIIGKQGHELFVAPTAGTVVPHNVVVQFPKQDADRFEETLRETFKSDRSSIERYGDTNNVSVLDRVNEVSRDSSRTDKSQTYAESVLKSLVSSTGVSNVTSNNADHAVYGDRFSSVVHNLNKSEQSEKSYVERFKESILTSLFGSKVSDSDREHSRERESLSERFKDSVLTSSFRFNSLDSEKSERISEFFTKFPKLNLSDSMESLVKAISNLVPSYDVGTPYVPRTGLALIHQGEAIIPASQNRGMERQFIFSPTINVPSDMTARARAQLLADISSESQRAMQRYK